MEFSLRIDGRVPDLIAIGRELSAVDPSVLFDVAASGQAVRISTVATGQELLECLHAAGVDAAIDDIVALPSACCGGCGG